MRKYSGAQRDPGHLATKVNPRLEVERVSEDTGVNTRDIDVESLELGRKPSMTPKGRVFCSLLSVTGKVVGDTLGVSALLIFLILFFSLFLFLSNLLLLQATIHPPR